MRAQTSDMIRTRTVTFIAAETFVCGAPEIVDMLEIIQSLTRPGWMLQCTLSMRMIYCASK